VLLESWAVSPGLEGTVVSRFNGFNRDILVSTERSGDRCFISKSDLVLWVGGVKTLEKGDGGVKDHGTLTTSLGVDVELVSVDDIRIYAGDIGRRGASQVDRAKERPELVRLGRAKRSTLGEGGLVSLGILVVFIPATVAGNNKNTEDVSHDGRVV